MEYGIEAGTANRYNISIPAEGIKSRQEEIDLMNKVREIVVINQK